MKARTTDDWLALAGSLVGSGGLVWLLYEQLLPFSGKAGFVISWFVVYVAMFAAVSALAHPRHDRDRPAVDGGHHRRGLRRRRALVSIGRLHHQTGLDRGPPPELLHPVRVGGAARTAPLTHGGILHAIVGSLIELGIATAISLPLGLGTAVFMVEVGGPFAKAVRTVVEAMTALPDILAGLFIYTFLIIALGFQRSGFAAGMALSVMMLPIIARTAYVR